MVNLLPTFATFQKAPEAAQILIDVPAQVYLVKGQIPYKIDQLFYGGNVMPISHLGDGGMHQLHNGPALASLGALHNARL